MVDLVEAKARLEARSQELLELSKISTAARDVVALDQQSVGRLSRMDALQQKAMADANERNRAHELSRIKAALARIEHDEYGYCLNCDEELPKKRLEIDPTAAICVNCAD